MTQYDHNDVMNLTWDSWIAPTLYVRGHMEPHEAHQALLDYYDDDDYQWEAPVPMYGRWSMGHGPEGGQGLMEYDEPGRGRFAIMVAPVKYRALGDPHAWNQRKGREFTRRPGEPFNCDCEDHWPSRCACLGQCSCHWYPLDAAREDGRVKEWKR